MSTRTIREFGARARRELSWKALRRGPIYCAPACGFNCTWADYLKAVEAASALCRSLGRGWMPVISENMGWHYHAAHEAGMSVWPSAPGTFWATTNGTIRQFEGYGKTPRAALKAALQKGRQAVAELSAIFASLEAL